jgi:hypothetical protein
VAFADEVFEQKIPRIGVGVSESLEAARDETRRHVGMF